jgi:arabinan endo-1,5-alpha-L-arabinosidase
MRTSGVRPVFREALRRTVLTPLLAVLICLAGAGGASASLSYRNPLRDVRTGKALTCPDPHVVDARQGGYRYFMVCTTDHEANAVAIHKSRDLVHWYPAGYVFPKGRQPWWARPTIRGGGGRFWAPEIYRIGRRWLIYFSAAIDSAKAGLPLKDGTMVVGVASSPTLRGPWRTRILHYRGQFNGSNPVQERFGGTIDPSVVRSPLDGRLYLFWALQATQIWAGRLSPDGMALEPNIRPVLKPSKPWECHPTCSIEAPEPFYRGGTLNLLYSGASTWDGSYAVGVALGTDPLTGSYNKANQPVLRSRGRFIATGHCSQPVTGPDGRTYVLYHALTSPDPSHVSNHRFLMLGRVSWNEDRLWAVKDSNLQP